MAWGWEELVTLRCIYVPQCTIRFVAIAQISAATGVIEKARLTHKITLSENGLLPGNKESSVLEWKMPYCLHYNSDDGSVQGGNIGWILLGRNRCCLSALCAVFPLALEIRADRAWINQNWSNVKFNAKIQLSSLSSATNAKRDISTRFEVIYSPMCK